MNHYAAPDFWDCYQRLPESVQKAADKAFAVLKTDPRHPSLRFKKVGAFWSARIGLQYRAIAVEAPDGVLWSWIGTHAEYTRLIR